MQQFLATLKKNGSAPPAAGIRGSAAAGGGGGGPGVQAVLSRTQQLDAIKANIDKAIAQKNKIMEGGDQSLLSVQAASANDNLKLSISNALKDAMVIQGEAKKLTNMIEVVNHADRVIDHAIRAMQLHLELKNAISAAKQRQNPAAAGGGSGAEEPPDECTICMNPLGVRNGPGADGTITTACHHRFHRKCINDWLNTGNTSCPNCRAALNPPFVGASGRRQYGAKRYRKRASRKQGTRKQGKYYKKKTRSAKSRNI
jgi:hypothetical protein